MVMLWRIFVVFFSLSLAQSAWADSATASLDRSITSSQESVQLTIHVDGSADNDPDLSVLKQDFEILSQGQSSSYSIINGSLSRSKSWQITLMPKHAGVLHIPSISLGNMTTNPLTLKVLDANTQAPQQQNQDVFLKMSASSVDVYVQAQVLLKVQLFRAVNLSQAQLSEPDVPHAIVKRLGEDKNYETVWNQRRYVVTERQYAVFPQESGRLTIPAVVMHGQISQGMGIFSQIGRVLRVNSNDVTLNVQPMPATWDANQAWLPASSVSLREIPDPHPLDDLQQGGSLTRTIEMRVHGLMAEQLPSLLPKAPLQGWKQYPDKPELKNEVDEHGVVGIRREKVALIPTQAGDLSLPAIDITWWNTQTQRVEHASVLKRIVSVAPNPSAVPKQPSQTSKAVQTQPTMNQTPVETDKKAVKEGVTSSLTSDHHEVQFWQGISAVLGMAWLLTMLWMMYGKKHPQKDEEALQAQNQTLKDARQSLKKACQHGDAKAVQEALQAWAKLVDEEHGLNMMQLKEKSDELTEAVNDLQRYLYSNHSAHWDAMQLWHAVNGLELQKKDAQASALRSL